MNSDKQSMSDNNSDSAIISHGKKIDNDGDSDNDDTKRNKEPRKRGRRPKGSGSVEGMYV